MTATVVIALVCTSAGAVIGAVLAVAAARRRAGTAVPLPRSGAQAALPPHVFEGALASLTSAAAVLDPDDRVVFDNEVARRLRLVSGRRLAVAALGRLVADLRATGAVGEREIEVEVPDGGAVTVLRVRAVPAGTAGHVALFAEDVTDARRVEAVRRDFVANVSHELKTPVGALGLLAEAIQEGEADADTVRRFASRMVHEAGRLSRLVQELIDLSRLQGAEARPPSTVVNLDVVLHEAVDRSRMRADAKAISITCEGDPSLVVRGDEAQLVTAVGNLLDNAIAYSANGTRIAIGSRRRDDHAEISVSDEGIGIAPADVDRIFERFYRADPARSRDTGGTGLGLAIVKHVAGNHGGRVSVWSVEGTGSTFTLSLPLAASSDVRSAGGAEQPRR
ncbi:MAG TPA: ATP-binding protein [Mycobacteriales bacterium]|nr:ATP-binding protein [Mycobacteriales bacterium]